jgi:hypothetical protein
MTGRKLKPGRKDDDIRTRMRLFMVERHAPEAEIARWMKGRVTTLRIGEFGRKYPVSYDWLLCGDLKGLLRMAKGTPHEAPASTRRPSESPEIQKLLDTFSPPQMAALAQLLEMLNLQL